MALLDLSSDLSRYRSEVSREPKNTPESSKATNNKNFATFQPISEKLSQYSTSVKKVETAKLETKLSSTKLDDIRKVIQKDLTINSVSKYSAINQTYYTRNINGVSLEDITSKFNVIQKFESVSRLDKSDTIVLRTNPGSNNLKSNTQINSGALTFDRKNTSPDIVKNSNDASDNVKDPNTKITRSEQTFDRTETSPDVFSKVPKTFDRTKQSVLINKDLISPLNNVVDPKIGLDLTTLTYERKSQTPNIITETIKQGLVVDPNTKVLRVENGTFNLEDNSRLNPDGIPIRFVTESKLIDVEPTQTPDTEKYSQESALTVDISNLNVDTVVKTIPFGRNEDPSKSRLSIIGTQQVNFFQDSNANGFIVKAQKGQTSYKDGSVFGWSGNSKSAPPTNFITDVNGKGFQTFTQPLETAYQAESSRLGFTNIPQTDFFDVTKQYTSEGFKTFVISLQTAYQEDASQFVWKGNSGQSPETNYFDINNSNTNTGFHKFAQLYDTKYIAESSQFDWDGSREQAPETNYFDLTSTNTTSGFHKFAQLYDTKYIVESSQFDWDGNREQAPETNYFDLTGTHTTSGFHKFAQLYDTKYVVESSVYDWDGNREQAPETNYFDLTSANTTAGFHRLAQLYDTKYIAESSQFDWDGTRDTSPEINYFDLTGKNTTAGFHRLAQLYDTKYIPESSIYDWDGNRGQAPEVNYFDLTSANTTAGFHKFAQLYDTKYIAESSQFDWDGTKQQAPAINYFDLTSANTNAGFHTFAQLYDTKYIPESSIYDWDGTRDTSPEVNYFDLTTKNTTTGFHRLAQLYDTKYVKESSIYDWDGNKQSAPEVNYFDLTGKNTTKGFHRNAELYDTKYVKDSSIFDWDGSSQAAPTTNFFVDGQSTGFTKFAPKLQSEYKDEISEFTFKGGLPSPVDFFGNTQGSGFVNKIGLLDSKYVTDISTFTFKGSLPTPVNFFTNEKSDGFNTKISLHDSKYKSDISEFTFKGSSQSAPSTNYFTDSINKGFTNFVQSLVTEYETEKSRFTFEGARSSAPAVDYITNTSATGFNILAPSLESKYTKDISRFTWVGNKQQSPSVDYFGIQGEDPKKITGFDNFFTNPSETKLSYEPSRFSFGAVKNLSPVKNAPYTTFFGFTPSERTGFMVGMTSAELSLYPIINPSLSVNDDPNKRYEIETQRAQQRRLKTQDEEKYAPLSLGRRPWVDGTLFSTLDNQIPQLKTNGTAGSFDKKYERTVKDSTEKLGYLTKWATTRRSPSPLDEQYNKYKLQKESTNSEPAFFHQPYVVRGIQRDGEVENQRWGFGVTFDDGIVRGGVVTQAERILMDVVRLGKWTASVKGLLFNIKQLGLQAMNPAVDVDPNTPTSGVFGVSSTLLYNPITMLANVATARAGVHLARHGINPFDSDYLNKYEKATVNRELKQRFVDEEYASFERLTAPGTVISDPPPGYNRLIGLMKEMLPASFSPLINASSTSTDPAALVSKAKSELSKLIFGQGRIARISSTFGGAQSYFGIGGTTIRKSSHPYLTFYTTAPNLYLTDKEPQYLDSAKRESFFGAIQETTYKDRLLSEQPDNNGDFYGIIKALTQIVDDGPTDPKTQNVPVNLKDRTPVKKSTKDKIEKLNPFNPRYEFPSDRIQKIDDSNSERVGSELHLGPSDLIDDYDTNPIKKYRTLAYNKLQKVRKGESNKTDRFNDFRHNLELSGSETFITNPRIARYDTRNQEDFFGMGKHGKVGAQRNIPYTTNIQYVKKVAENGSDDQPEFKNFAIPKIKPGGGYEFRGDRINIIDYKRANFNITKDLVYEKGQYGDPSLPGAEDFVEFYFSSLVLSGHKNCPAEVIVFRATFDSISDNHKPSWNSVKYMGRADPLYVYQGYERSISFGFTVHIGSRDEMKASWRKLNYLASWTAPEYTSAGYIRGPMIRLNIGNLYRKMPGYLANLTYTFDNTQGTWETAKLLEDQKMDGTNKSISGPGVLQLPKTIQVSCEFVPVGVYRPEFRGTMYSLYDDTGNSPENGLIPKNDNKVNYFKSFDDVSMNQPENRFYLPVAPDEEGIVDTTGSAESIQNLFEQTT